MGPGLRQNGSGPVRLISGHPFSHIFRTIRDIAAQAVFPQVCLICGAPVSGTAVLNLCPDCSTQVEMCGNNVCPRCGAPSWAPASCLCKNDIHFDTVRSPFVWNGPVRDIVLALKYARRWELAASMAGPLVSAWRAAGMSMPNVVVPVPIGAGRVLTRGYNQSALLGRSTASRLGVQFSESFLARDSSGISTKGHGRQFRIKTARNAFRATRPGSLKGMTVLLVDDVMTTGATASACSACLKNEGASRVDVLTFARAVLS